jgi:hypothetical protein
MSISAEALEERYAFYQADFEGVPKDKALATLKANYEQDVARTNAKKAELDRKRAEATVDA